LRAFTGSSADIFRVEDPNGVSIFRVNKLGILEHRTIAAGQPAIRFFIDSDDTQPSILIDSSVPEIRLGPGGATAPPLRWYRDTSGRMHWAPSSAGSILDINTATARADHLFQVWSTDRANPGGSRNTMAVTKVENQINASAGTFLGHALGVTSIVGSDGTNVVGTGHGFTSLQQIYTVGNSANEFTPQANYQADFTTVNSPRIWLTDWIQVGPAVQPNLMTGFTICMNNHYNGRPSSAGIFAAVEVTTQTWAPSWANPNQDGSDDGRPTYPIDAGVHITGNSGNGLADNLRDGFSVALRIGGQGHAWPNTGQRFGKGIEISAWRTHGIHISGRFSGSTGPAIQVASGIGEILSPNGISTRTKAGTISDSDFNNPATGLMAIDETNGRLYCRYSNGQWHFATLT